MWNNILAISISMIIVLYILPILAKKIERLHHKWRNHKRHKEWRKEMIAEGHLRAD